MSILHGYVRMIKVKKRFLMVGLSTLVGVSFFILVDKFFNIYIIVNPFPHGFAWDYFPLIFVNLILAFFIGYTLREKLWLFLIGALCSILISLFLFGISWYETFKDFD